LTWEVTSIRVGNGVEGFDISPNGKEIWAANARDATLTIIDIASKKAVQTFPIPLRGANRVKFTPDGTRVLISGLGAGQSAGAISLVVLDAPTRKEVKQFNLGGGAAGILIAPDGSRAYVAVSTADKIVVVDLKTLEVVGQFSPGKQPDGMAWAVRK
jgi:YVTN family beta-propeller protein